MKYGDRGLKAICLILSFALAMAAGAALLGKSGGGLQSPKAAVFGADKSEITREIFVSGAVQREGNYTVSADMTYRELFVLCGLYAVSHIARYDYDKYVDITEGEIILGYFQDGMIWPSVNINEAGLDELVFLGLGGDAAQAVIDGRPYGRRDELFEEGILSPEEFLTIEHKIFAGEIYERD